MAYAEVIAQLKSELGQLDERREMLTKAIDALERLGRDSHTSKAQTEAAVVEGLRSSTREESPPAEERAPRPTSAPPGPLLDRILAALQDGPLAPREVRLRLGISEYEWRQAMLALIESKRIVATGVTNGRRIALA